LAASCEPACGSLLSHGSGDRSEIAAALGGADAGGRRMREAVGAALLVGGMFLLDQRLNVGGVLDLGALVVTASGCGQLLMFLKGGNTILVDFLPELVPPVFGEDEGSQAEDDLSALWGPAHSRATQPLFDQSFACGLCDA